MNLVITIVALAFAVVALIVAYAWAKKSLITHAATIIAETSHGERVQMNVNFSSRDSKADKEKKLNELFDLLDERREIAFKRMADKVREEQEKNAAAKLESLN